MSYTRRTWKDGEVIDAEKLNNLEEGVAEAKQEAGQTKSHTHGNISNDGKIGSAEGLPVFTGTGGVVQTVSVKTAREKLGVPDTDEAVTEDGENPVSGAAVAAYVAEQIAMIADYDGEAF